MKLGGDADLIHSEVGLTIMEFSTIIDILEIKDGPLDEELYLQLIGGENEAISPKVKQFL